MKKILITLAALGSLAVLSGLALPAVAQSDTNANACASQPAVKLGDINAMPAGPVVGHQSIKGGVGDDGCGAENERHEGGHEAGGDSDN